MEARRSRELSDTTRPAGALTPTEAGIRSALARVGRRVGSCALYHHRGGVWKPMDVRLVAASVDSAKRRCLFADSVAPAGRQRGRVKVRQTAAPDADPGSQADDHVAVTSSSTSAAAVDSDAAAESWSHAGTLRDLAADGTLASLRALAHLGTGSSAAHVPDVVIRLRMEGVPMSIASSDLRAVKSIKGAAASVALAARSCKVMELAAPLARAFGVEVAVPSGRLSARCSRFAGRKTGAKGRLPATGTPLSPQCPHGFYAHVKEVEGSRNTEKDEVIETLARADVSFVLLHTADCPRVQAVRQSLVAHDPERNRLNKELAERQASVNAAGEFGNSDSAYGAVADNGEASEAGGASDAAAAPSDAVEARRLLRWLQSLPAHVEPPTAESMTWLSQLAELD